jgi:dCTP deaminase
MILTDRQILEAHRSREIVIEPFAAEQIQGATYDLRVGDQGATTSGKRVVNLKEAGFISIQPGDFAVLTVLEIIRLGPQFVGRFGLRSKFARKGLIATTGPQIDPGFHGRLIIGITNLSPRPVSLSHGDDFVSLEIHKLEEASTKPYSGPYQDKVSLGPDEIESITESEGMALSEMLTSLRVLTQNVGTLASDVTTLTTEMKSLKFWVPFIVTIGFAILSILVAFKN